MKPAPGPVLIPPPAPPAKPARPSTKGQAKPDGPEIRLAPAEASKAVPQPTRAQLAYWDGFFRRNDHSPSRLLATVNSLRAVKKFGDVEAALRAYLTHRNTRAESWMYNALALAIEVNAAKGDTAKLDEVRTYLGYAAAMARRNGDADELVTAADNLITHGSFEQAKPLLDLASERRPAAPAPLLMSMQVAERTADAPRMARAAEAWLSLGWPGADPQGRTFDDQMRGRVRAQVEALAKALRERDRTAEADALLAKLPEWEARDLLVRLTWVGVADLDLIVGEPLGATVRLEAPRSVFGGALLKNGDPKNREEIYVCPRGFDGEYTIRAQRTFYDPDKPVTEATLEVITHEGTSAEKVDARTIPIGATPTPVVIRLDGGRRTRVLPFEAPADSARPPAARPAATEKPTAPATAPTAKPR